jgi:hypothetical protein
MIDRYKDCMVGSNYADAMASFGQNIQAQAEMVLNEQTKAGIPPDPLTAEDCYPHDHGDNRVSEKW